MKKNKKADKQNPLSDIQWTMCWMAIRYAMNRKTIASSMLPGKIIQSYYDRFTHLQKQQIVKDLQRQYKMFGIKAFGDPVIDRPSWLKFWKAMQVSSHQYVHLKNGLTYKAFFVDNRWYPLQQYVKHPFVDTYILNQDIDEVQNVWPMFEQTWRDGVR